MLLVCTKTFALCALRSSAPLICRRSSLLVVRRPDVNVAHRHLLVSAQKSVALATTLLLHFFSSFYPRMLARFILLLLSFRSGDQDLSKEHSRLADRCQTLLRLVDTIRVLSF